MDRGKAESEKWANNRIVFAPHRSARSPSAVAHSECHIMPSSEVSMDKNNKDQSEGCFHIIIFWGTLFGGGFVLKKVDEASPGSGSTMIYWILVAIAGWIVWKVTQAMIVDGAEKTKSNMKYIFGGIFKILVVIIVIGFVGNLFHSCGGGGISLDNVRGF